MVALKSRYTSDGSKLFFHQEAMRNLRNGKGQAVVSHIMLTDVCNHTCAFCSVQARAGDSLAFDDVLAYLDILMKYGLKAVILSGGGNPILYKCKKTGKNFNDIVDAIHVRELQIGLITNGMPLKRWASPASSFAGFDHVYRDSWRAVRPETLDKLTWIRISMAGLDHEENEVYVPDIDPTKTTLGFSYIGHDLFFEPADPHHGKVSTPGDVLTLDRTNIKPTWWFKDRVPVLTEQIRHYVERYNPAYVRLLPNCLEPSLISERVAIMQGMADAIDPQIVFVQHKPPHAPNKCFIGYLHPVLNACGGVFPCDAVVLAAAEVGYQEGKPNHKFDSPWRLCHWSEVAKLYEEPIHSLVDSRRLCAGCVFWQQNEILEGVVDGTIEPTPPTETPTHANFV
jgi:hypothetical protein